MGLPRTDEPLKRLVPVWLRPWLVPLLVVSAVVVGVVAPIVLGVLALIAFAGLGLMLWRLTRGQDESDLTRNDRIFRRRG
jgi:hypothetical protein